MQKNKTREKLIEEYIKSLNEGEIPWRKRWVSGANINGISKIEYKGVNQLLLNFISYLEKYNDNRWFTYVQIKDNGWKLNNAKGKGVPIEYWNVYDIKNKRSINFDEYQAIVDKNPELEKIFRVYSKTTSVYNASLIEGVPEVQYNKNNIETSKYITNLIKRLGVKYEEHDDRAFYSPLEDKVVLPNKDKFIDQYSYYATQLHELCHSTGSEKRLNRNLLNNDKREYAREELIAEISSSFLMQKLNIDPKASHIDNHKSYIQSWISILKDKPNELFKAINESNKVCSYIDELQKNRNKDKER